MRFHRFQLVFAVLVALLDATNISAQQSSAAPRSSSAQQQVLPDSFGTWHSTGCVDKPVRPTTLSVEAGERDFQSCQFTSGKQSAAIWAGKYRDPSSAYEVYTSILRPTMSPSTVGRFTAVDDKGLLALVGDVVIGVDQPRNVSTKDLQELTSIIAARADRTPLPPIREYLPKEDLVNGSQRYSLGVVGLKSALEPFTSFVFRSRSTPDSQREKYLDITNRIGFGSGAEMMLGEYQNGREGALLLLIDYPTPQLAELHLRHLEPALADVVSGASVERNGSLLSVVLGPSSSAYAQKLHAGVNYHTQVTWNEPSQTATDPPWALVLYRIFLGTGVFMVAAIAFGVAFGGFRVFVKKLLPGKVFDRPEQMEVLQLGLSGNKIDTRGLY
jgi:hypothetical protein